MSEATWCLIQLIFFLYPIHHYQIQLPAVCFCFLVFFHFNKYPVNLLSRLPAENYNTTVPTTAHRYKSDERNLIIERRWFSRGSCLCRTVISRRVHWQREGSLYDNSSGRSISLSYLPATCRYWGRKYECAVPSVGVGWIRVGWSGVGWRWCWVVIGCWGISLAVSCNSRGVVRTSLAWNTLALFLYLCMVKLQVCLMFFLALSESVRHHRLDIRFIVL